MKRSIFILILTIVTLAYSGCKEEETCGCESETGKVSFVFKHQVEGEQILFDTTIYINEAGNHYQVNEIQYFISDVTLHSIDGTTKVINEWKDIYYIDTDIEETWTWDVFDDIPKAVYESISFTFGISEDKNHSLMFTDPPESFMFWPEYLGGGYHYMKLNGKWNAIDEQVKPFNFHLGIGQTYDNEGEITGFIHNDFRVDVASVFSIETGETTSIEIIMNVEEWFKDPNTYDHDDWGGDIMQKQDAMKLGCENGHNVFSLGKIEIEDE
jgi:hypothetical protein